MQTQPDLNGTKYQTTSKLIDQPQNRIESFQEFIQNQCFDFLRDVNTPSQYYIFETKQRPKFGDQRTFDDTDIRPNDNEQYFLQEIIQSYELQNVEQIEAQSQTKPQKNLERACQYAKKYREKQKQKLKGLQDQNRFLKKKIDELQSRLRQRQLELSRLKFSNNQQQYSLQKINDDIIKKLNIITQSNIGQKSQIQQKQKIQYRKKDKLVQQFLQIYEIHGFGGLKTVEVLEYYTNEFLQNVMRDRQKYHFLICIKNKHLNQTKPALDIAIDQAIPSTEEQRIRQLKFFDRFRPNFQQIKQKCRQFYKSSREVIAALQKIQETSRKVLEVEIQQAIKPMKTALWFHMNRYHKQVRNLRDEWIDLVKNPEVCSLEKGSSVKKKRVKGGDG